MATSEKILIKLTSDMADLAPNYLSNRKNDLIVLKQALSQSNSETIQKISHKVKGTAGGYGFDGLGAIAKELEMAAKTQDFQKATSLLRQMEDYLKSVEIEVDG